MNPKVMGIAHDYLAANQPDKNPKGRLWMNSFHVSPDKGLGGSLFWYKREYGKLLTSYEREDRKFCNKVWM